MQTAGKIAMKTMSDIANSAKVTLIWRGVLALLTTLVAAGVGILISNSNRDSDRQEFIQTKILSKIDAAANDVAQIKWEVPVIKETAVRDKAEVLKQLSAMEERLQSIRNLTDTDRREISELKLNIALLKQKLQLP